MRLAGAGIAIALCAVGCPLDAAAAVRTHTNGILSVEVADAGPEVGMFSIRTGAAHPYPLQSVLFGVGTSYVTLRDNTAQEVWTNAGAIVNTEIVPYVFRSMQAPPATATVENAANGFRVRYVLPNWTVTHDLAVLGATLADSSVRHTVTVTNTSAVTRSYGVRNLLDWDIGGIDALFLRTLHPVSAYTSTFAAFDAPAFAAFEQIGDLGTPTFAVYGTIRGGPLAPTPPDRFGYVAWQDLYEAPWDITITGQDADSATVHYWGYVAPLSLAPGASATFTLYLSTTVTAIGATSDPVAEIPMLSPWTIVVLGALLLTLAMRDRGASRIRSHDARR